MDQPGGVEILQHVVVSCYRNQDKLQHDGPLGLYADLNNLPLIKQQWLYYSKIWSSYFSLLFYYYFSTAQNWSSGWRAWTNGKKNVYILENSQIQAKDRFRKSVSNDWYKSGRKVSLQQEPKGWCLFIVTEENPEHVNHLAIVRSLWRTEHENRPQALVNI